MSLQCQEFLKGCKLCAPGTHSPCLAPRSLLGYGTHRPVASKAQDIFFPCGVHKAWVRNCCQGWKNPIFLLPHGLTKFYFCSLWALEGLTQPQFTSAQTGAPAGTELRSELRTSGSAQISLICLSRVSHCNPNWPGTCSVDHSDLKIRDLPVSAS